MDEHKSDGHKPRGPTLVAAERVDRLGSSIMEEWMRPPARGCALVADLHNITVVPPEPPSSHPLKYSHLALGSTCIAHRTTPNTSQAPRPRRPSSTLEVVLEAVRVQVRLLTHPVRC